jgi:branched-subunit amino acid transport protein AzlD
VEEHAKNPITHWGRFVSPEMESAYQSADLTWKLKRARLLLWLMCLAVLLFFYQDFVLFGYSTRLYIGAGLRLAFLACAALALLRLRRSVTLQQLENWMTGCCAFLALLVVWGYASRPIEKMNHGMNVLMILALGIVAPMRFSYQAIMSATFAAATYLVLLSKRPDPFIAFGVFFVTLLSVAFGLITAASLHRLHRQRFAALQSETRLRQSLESAMKEIKTLHGMLPICAACKKIRQDDGVWRQIEAYLLEHTEAQFSHGICPDCQARFYPESIRTKTV